MRIAKKIFRVGFFVIGSIILLGFIFTGILDWYLKDKIQSELVKITKGECSVNIGDVDSRIWTGSLSIYNLSIKNESNLRNTKLISFIASSIELRGINILGLFSKDQIKAERINVISPEIEFRRGVKIDSVISTDSSGLYGIIKDHYKSLLIQKIDLSNLRIKYFMKDDSLSVLNIGNGNITVKNFLIDSTLQKDNSRVFNAEKFDINLKKINYLLKDSIYTISVSNLATSSENNEITFDSLIVHPNYSKYEFGRKVGHQTDRLDLYCEKIILSNRDSRTMLGLLIFDAENLQIGKMDLHAFRDKHEKFVPEKKLFVQSLLKSIPFEFNIDTLSIEDGNVTYEERNIQSSNSGKISFNRMEVVLCNITNRNSNTADSLKVTASAFLNNTGKINMNLFFPLQKDTQSFYCTGTMGRMKMKDLNSIMKNNAFLYFTNGEIDSLWFQFKAGKEYSNGRMFFLYHDLRIALKEKDENDTTEIKEKVMSFFANTFILKQDNPQKNRDAQRVLLYHSRDPHKFIFNYSWKTILSGIKKTIGMPEKK